MFDPNVHLLSLPRDAEQIANQFFAGLDQTSADLRHWVGSTQHAGFEKALKLLGNHCKSEMADVIFVQGSVSSKKRRTWFYWLAQPNFFEWSVRQLERDLKRMCSMNNMILIAKDFEAQILIDILTRAYEAGAKSKFVRQTIGTVILESCDADARLLSSLSELQSPSTEARASSPESSFGRRLAQYSCSLRNSSLPFCNISINHGGSFSSELSHHRGFRHQFWYSSGRQRLKETIDLLCSSRYFRDALNWSVLQLLAVRKESYLKISLPVPISSPTMEGDSCSSTKLRNQLDNMLRKKSASSMPVILKVLRWVAYARRPLKPAELFAAVTTDTALDDVDQAKQNRKSACLLSNQDEMFEICAGLVERTSQDSVCFTRDYLKVSALSHKLRTLDTYNDNQVHEMIAAVCLRHVVCFHVMRLLQPWACTGELILGQTGLCPLREYSELNWHHHYRIAETSSMYLPTILHEALTRALTLQRAEAGLGQDGSAAKAWAIDQGLLFCASYDFVRLGRIYVEMGAALAPSDSPALPVAAANDSINILKLLTEKIMYIEHTTSPFSREASASLLEIAAAHNSVFALEHLLGLEKFESIETQNGSRLAALAVATALDHKEAVELPERFVHTSAINTRPVTPHVPGELATPPRSTCQDPTSERSPYGRRSTLDKSHVRGTGEHSTADVRKNWLGASNCIASPPSEYASPVTSHNMDAVDHHMLSTEESCESATTAEDARLENDEAAIHSYLSEPGQPHSRGGVPLLGRGSKKRKHYPPAWSLSTDKVSMKKRLLCAYDGERRLWKDDLMMHNEYEVRMALPDGKSYATDLDAETLTRAELQGIGGVHSATWFEDRPSMVFADPNLDIK